MSDSSHSNIPVIVIGVNRSTAVQTASIFDNTPYYVAAIVDLNESPEQYQYSTQNLGTVLHALYPRPRVLVTGTAVERIVPGARKVWDEYVEGTLRVEDIDGGKAVYVPVSL
jgi:hypothetical protein